MELKQAIKILEAHNRWRRGEDVEPMVEPTEIGDAIDVVVEYVKNNIVLDDVINCPRCGGSYVVTDLDDRCLCKDCKTKWRVCL
jgi:ribosomal protein S27AE